MSFLNIIMSLFFSLLSIKKFPLKFSTKNVLYFSSLIYYLLYFVLFSDTFVHYPRFLFSHYFCLFSTKLCLISTYLCPLISRHLFSHYNFIVSIKSLPIPLFLFQPTIVNPELKMLKQKTPSHDKMMFLRPRYLRYPTLIIILALFFALRNNVSSFA